MLSSVLNSEQAIRINIAIMGTFVAAFFSLPLRFSPIFAGFSSKITSIADAISRTFDRT